MLLWAWQPALAHCLSICKHAFIQTFVKELCLFREVYIDTASISIIDLINNVAKKKFKVIWERAMPKLPVLMILPWVLQYLRGFFNGENKTNPKNPHPWSETDCISISAFILYMEIQNSCGHVVKENESTLKSHDFYANHIFRGLTFFFFF